MTSMATASTLMTERMGRRSKLAKMSLFMFEHGLAGDQKSRTTRALALDPRVTARTAERPRGKARLCPHVTSVSPCGAGSAETL